jgi:hypothetical protein
MSPKGQTTLRTASNEGEAYDYLDAARTSACKMHEEWSSVVQMHYTDFLLQLINSADRKK